MIVNNVVTGFIAIIIGYLLGSIPFAYIFTRLASGRDVREVSGGNVGARNTFRNIGKPAGITTALLILPKVLPLFFIASRLNNSPILSDLAWLPVLSGGGISGGRRPYLAGFSWIFAAEMVWPLRSACCFL